jgi:hypothetical protein
VASLVIKTADEFMTPDALERLAARRAVRHAPLVRQILRAFVERGGPIAFRDLVADRDALVALDDEDVIRVRGDEVDIAYPFSAAPTPFLVRLSGGRERYACCAMDALGIASMLGEPVEIRSRCHHCGEALEFSATPDGPRLEAGAIMLWFGTRGDDRRKVADSL